MKDCFFSPYERTACSLPLSFCLLFSFRLSQFVQNDEMCATEEESCHLIWKQISRSAERGIQKFQDPTENFMSSEAVTIFMECFMPNKALASCFKRCSVIYLKQVFSYLVSITVVYLKNVIKR